MPYHDHHIAATSILPEQYDTSTAEATEDDAASMFVPTTISQREHGPNAGWGEVSGLFL
jgi:hypothetical protein